MTEPPGPIHPPDWVTSPPWLCDEAAPRLALCESPGPNRLDLLAAARLAVEDSGGSVDLREFDDRRDAGRARDVARQAVNLHADAVVGHFSSVAAMAASRVYHEHGMPFIAPGASHPDLCGDGARTTLRFFGSDVEQLACLVGVAKPKSRVVILAQQGNYGARLGQSLQQALSGTASNADLHVVGGRPRPPRPSNLDRCDLVYILGSQEFALPMLAALTVSSSVTCVLSDDSYMADLADLAKVAPMPSDTYVAFLATEDDWLVDRPSSGLRLRATSLLGRAPGPYFFTSYLGLRALCEAWESEPGRSGADVVERLKRGSWRTPFGRIRLTDAGEMVGHSWSLSLAGGLSGLPGHGTA